MNVNKMFRLCVSSSYIVNHHDHELKNVAQGFVRHFNSSKHAGLLDQISFFLLSCATFEMFFHLESFAYAWQVAGYLDSIADFLARLIPGP